MLSLVRPRLYRRSRGFALVELLTVIAIIAVLGALSLAGISKVRSSARWVQGTANIRQVTVGMLMLAGENRGRLLHWNEIKPDGTSGNWGILLTQYLNGQNPNSTPYETHPVLRDPLVPTTSTAAGIYHFASPDLQAPDRSRDSQFSNVFSSFARYRNLNGYLYPSRQIYFADAATNADGAGAHGNLTSGDLNLWVLLAQTPSMADEPIAPGPGTPGNIRWTEGRAKFGFLDGHVAILRQEEVKRRNINPAL